MEYTRVKYAEHPLFDAAWELYTQSFPRRERRQLRTQIKTLADPLYHFEVVTEGATFVGIVLWWGFEDVRYIEHLAVAPSLRGWGYGRRILERFTAAAPSPGAASPLPVLLEVEHPTDPISRRRVEFYRRAGFVLNEHEYTHPPYKRCGAAVSLMLMTWPEAITPGDAARFSAEYHPVIFRTSR